MTKRDEARTIQRGIPTPYVWYEQVRWGRADGQVGPLPTGPILLLDNDERLGEVLVKTRPVLLVTQGKHGRQVSPHHYEVDGGNQPALTDLFQRFRREQPFLVAVVYRWADVPAESGTIPLEAELERSIYGIVSVCKALLEAYKEGPPRLLVHCRRGRTALRPTAAALVGFLRTLRQEHPDWEVGFVETDAESPAELVQEITAEAAMASQEPHVRYQGGLRFTGRLVATDLTTGADKVVAADRVAEFAPGGVYVITGGLGGLGLLFAQYLAARYGARLLLAGRSALTTEKEGLVQELQRAGGNVLYVQADVSVKADVERLVSTARQRFGRINGVLHTAGITRDSLMMTKNRDAIAAVLAPKVHGVMHLDAALRDEPLDFMLLFSSMAAEVGNVGQCDYSFANSFLDQFAQWRETERAEGRRQGITLSVGWPLWAEGGMQLSAERQGAMREQLGLEALPTELGLAAAETILYTGTTRCVVLCGQKDRWEEVRSRLFATAGAKRQAISPGCVQIDAGCLARTELWLKAILAEMLKLPPARIDTETSIRQYGIDSVRIEHFNMMVEERMGSVPKTLLFEYESVKELRDYLVTHHAEKVLKLFGSDPVGPEQPTGLAASPQESVAETPIQKKGRLSSLRDKHRGARSYRAPQREDAAAETAIAIVGVSGRYPQAATLDLFWENMKAGRDCITEIPDSRGWNVTRHFDPDPEQARNGKLYCKWGGFLNDVDKFDARFFHISPREAEVMDPQERLFLETAWATLEDAGYTRKRLLAKAGNGKSANVGVFVGTTTNTYLLHGPEEWHKGNHVIPTSFPWSVANRISFFCNFSGPSIALDTACSSSLTAIHLACQSLRKGECRMAIAGGVNLYLHPSRYVGMSQMRMLSASGRCRTFGAESDGIVPGEGVGAVLLRPLADAVRDGDHIYAIIRGSSINHGGTTNGYSVPSPSGQADLVRDALNVAGIDPRTISYLEAHGTGTVLGDPIEITALSRAFRAWTADTQFCAIGSVKTSIGHLEAAAGIAGLTKVLLQMKHKQLVPSLHAAELNPKIEFADSPFSVQQTLTRWEKPVLPNGQVAPRRAAISSFGAGGANAHLIVEEFEAEAAGLPTGADQPQLVILSAATQEQLTAYASSLAEYLKGCLAHQTISLLDVAYALQVGREALEQRLALVVGTVAELTEALSRFVRGESALTPLMEDRQLGALGELWATGVDVDFESLYTGVMPRAVSLPTYPFARERHWIPQVEPPVSPVLESVHPLIGTNTSILSEQTYAKRFSGHEFYLRDHLGLLPGVVYLEMSRAAGEHAVPGGRVTCIRNLVLVSPIYVRDGERDVTVALQPSNESVAFTVRTESAVHAQGQLIYDQASVTSERIDVHTILNRTRGGEQAARQYYERLAALGVPFGQRFQGIREFYWNDTEALAVAGVAPEEVADQERYTLHPVLMDAGLQSVVAWVYKRMGEPEVVYLPFVLGELEILRDRPEITYVYVRQTSGGESEPEGAQFEVLYLNRDGDVVVRLRNYSIRRLAREQANTVPPDAQGAPDQVLYFRPEWETRELRVGAYAEGPLLLLDTDETVAQSLRMAGAHVIRVGPGAGFRKVDSLRYEIAPGSRDDYRQLLEHLKACGELPSAIVHTWAREPKTPGASAATLDGLDLGFYSLFFLTQALVAITPTPTVQVLYLYRSASGVVAPQDAAVGGFARTVLQEVPQIHVRTVGLGECHVADLARYILAELSEAGSGEHEVRYERERRLVRTLREVPVGNHRNPPVWREEGVYLITGGVGGLGRIFAQHLARTCKARLVLVGRSPNEQVQPTLDVLQRAGADVLYIQADTSVPADVQRLVAMAKARFGVIHGVIQAAGVLRDRLVGELSLDDLEQVLAPKLKATLLLDEALSDMDLDFVLYCSSLAGVTGSRGQSAYAYANAFLDAHAEYCRQTRRHGRTISVDWPLWRDGGMRMDEATRQLVLATSGLRPIETSEGIRALDALLATGMTQAVVTAGDAPTIRKVLTSISAGSPRTRETGTAAPVASGLQTLVEIDLLRLMSTILKLRPDSFHADTRISELGFDSITFTELANALNRTLALNVTPAIFFGHARPASIVRFLCEQHGDALRAHYEQQTAAPGQRGEAPRARVECNEPLPTRYPVAQAQAEAPEPVAIIGMAGVMPQSPDLEAFWNNLESGRDLITEIPADRWDWRAFYGDANEEAGKTKVIWGGFMPDADKFDSRFFNISPRDAELMDPQERLALETVWKAIEGAGYRASSLAGTRTGVFFGVSNADYQELLVAAEQPANFCHAILANRLSYFFDFHGPSEPIDTACSSSLVAIDRGVNAIQRGDCELAVAGGVNLIASPNLYIFESLAGMLSPEGRCKTFDESADGYVRGEGVGAVLLKPLHRAIADGDHIYAVIRSTAVNHGGHTSSLTAPSALAQAELLVDAYNRAGVDPATIGYIETHGTGTKLGDPIEIEGLKMAFNTLYQKWHKPVPQAPHCGLSTVKTNAGHLESAAGISGLIKVLLAMQHKKIPGILHFRKLNPHIDLKGSPFYIVSETRPWPALQDETGQVVPRRAGVSSFGIGGVNAHIVLEEYLPASAEPVEQAASGQVILLSARTEERLQAYAGVLLRFLRQKYDGHGNASARLLAEVRAEITRASAAILEVDEADLEAADQLSDQGLDAMGFRQLTDHLAEVYGVVIPSSVMGAARSADGLAAYVVRQCGDRLRSSSEVDAEEAALLGKLAYTVQTGREPMSARLGFVVTSLDQLCERLEQYGRGEKEHLFTGQVPLQAVRPLVSERLQPSSKEPPVSELAELTSRWVSGAEVDWSPLHEGQVRKRLPIPTYPFARRRFWVPETGKATTPKVEALPAQKLHPLLDSNTSTFAAQQFTAFLTGQEYYLVDHLLGGQKVLPGAAYLEMARAAVALAANTGPIRLRNVTWVQPAVVPATASVTEPFALHVRLQARGEEASFEVHSTAGVHAQGNVSLTRTSSGFPAARVELDPIRKRCSTAHSAETWYGLFDQGIHLGPSFQTVAEWSGNAQEALACLVLPAHLRAEASAYTLHPSLIDGAFQTVMGLLNAGDEAGAGFLPFALEELVILGPVTGNCYVYAQLADPQSQAAGIRKFHLTLADDTGTVLVQIRNFAVRQPSRVARTSSFQRKSPQQVIQEVVLLLKQGKLQAHEADEILGGLYEHQA